MDVSALLEGVLNQMHEGLQVISPNWRYLFVNETVAAQGKRTRDELLGRTMMECYPGIDKTPMFAQLRACMEKRVSIRMENEFHFPDGSVGWFELLMHPVTEGVLILSLDVTARKLAEKELHVKIEELDRVMNLSIAREMRMAELKKLVIDLKRSIPPLEPQAQII